MAGDDDAEEEADNDGAVRVDNDEDAEEVDTAPSSQETVDDEPLVKHHGVVKRKVPDDTPAHNLEDNDEDDNIPAVAVAVLVGEPIAA